MKPGGGTPPICAESGFVGFVVFSSSGASFSVFVTLASSVCCRGLLLSPRVPLRTLLLLSFQLLRRLVHASAALCGGRFLDRAFQVDSCLP